MKITLFEKTAKYDEIKELKYEREKQDYENILKSKIDDEY